MTAAVTGYNDTFHVCPVSCPYLGFYTRLLTTRCHHTYTPQRPCIRVCSRHPPSLPPLARHPFLPRIHVTSNLKSLVEQQDISFVGALAGLPQFDVSLELIWHPHLGQRY